MSSLNISDAATESSLTSATGEAEPRLKIAVLAPCPFPANHGTPGSIRELSEATAERGHEVHVVTYHFGDDLPLKRLHLQRIADWTGETAVKVGPTLYRPLYDLLLVFKAIAVVRKHDVDVIHGHNYEGGLAAALCRLITRRPVVYSAHNTMGDELASYDFFRFKWIAHSLAWVLDAIVPRLGNRCIPHSENIVPFLRQRGLENRMEPVIPWGIDLRQVPADCGQQMRLQYGLDDQPVVLYAGVMDAFQRLDLLIDAMALVVRHIPDAKLVFVVTVADEKQQTWIRQRAAERGIEGNILMTPPQSLDGALRHLWMADVTVVPRPDTPGFPIKLMNYMATRRSTVLFQSSSCGAQHGKHVWEVGPDTPEALAEGIIHLLEDAPLRAQLGEDAYQYVKCNHDRRSLARNVCRAYMNVLKGTRRQRTVMKRPRVEVDDTVLNARHDSIHSPEKSQETHS